ncbi:MAG: RluA family pseudouridine synthase [Planctomycetota bacterium]
MAREPGRIEDEVFRVDPHWRGLRLDHFLREMIPSMSRSKIQRYLRAGLVTVDGRPRAANAKVQTGEEVRLRPVFPGEDLEAGRRIELAVLHEDEDLIAVDKPAGLRVHPAAGHRHDTLLNALEWRYAGTADGPTPTLAHRLDRDTSGVVVAARHREAREHLQRQFEERRVAKTYLALVEGVPVPDAGAIDLPLAAARDPRAVRKTLVVSAEHADAKPARTDYAVVERFAPRAGLPRGAALVEACPHTGRQHQIRVHLAALGHPILGDDRYGQAPPLELGAARLERCALHAARLELDHPRDGRRLEFVAPLPADLLAAVAAMRAG